MSVTPYPTALPPPSALGDFIRLLTTKVAQPDVEPAWRAHVASLVDPLRAAFAQHCAATEGTGGQYAEVVQDAPRLAGTVDRLVAEHATLDGAIDRLAGAASSVTADAQTLRLAALTVLDDLARHRQHDSDLIYEAYQTDIGGERG